VNPYMFQVALAILLMYGAVIGTTKFILEVYGVPVLDDEEWELERAQRNDLG
jgi:hypothetical protein